VASCEFSGKLLVIDREATTLVKVIDLSGAKAPGVVSPGGAMPMGGARSNLQPGASAMPQDVRSWTPHPSPSSRCGRFRAEGSRDMGGVTADGSQLWLSGCYKSEVYVFDTVNGAA
jgi:hypothetical protein